MFGKGIMYFSPDHVATSLRVAVLGKKFLSCPPVLCLCCCLLTKSYLSLWRHHGLQPTWLLSPGEFSGMNFGVGCYFCLLGIFPPDPGIEPESLASPALAGGFCTAGPPGQADHCCRSALFPSR